MMRLQGPLAALLFLVCILSAGAAKAGPVCTTDTLQLVGFTVSDQALFLSVPSERTVTVTVELDSTDWDAIPDRMLEVRTELVDANTDTVVASKQETYDVTDIELSPYMGLSVTLGAAECHASGGYRFEIWLDPDGDVPDCNLGNNQVPSPDFNLDIYSGRLRFGDVDTVVSEVTSYNDATKQVTGKSMWNDEVEISFAGLGLAFDTGCDARVISGNGSFLLPQPVDNGNWMYYTTAGLANSTGAFTNPRIPLPEGILYKQNATDRLYREGRVAIGPQRINQDYRLTDTYTVLGVVEVKAENMPFSMGFASLKWNDGDGFILDSPTYTYIHDDEFTVAPFARRSNDRLFYSHPDFSDTIAYIRPQGLEANLEFNTPGDVIPAFPYGIVVVFDSAKVQIEESLIAAGSLTPAIETELMYNTNGCFGASSVTSELFKTTDYDITPDGAMGAALDGGASYDFAWDAFQLEDIVNGRMYLPGFIGVGKSTGVPLPSEYLLAGRTGNGMQPSQFAMSGEVAYLNGFGDYAGLTVHRPEMEGKSFKVTIACAPLPLTATSFSKVYARQGGFNGVLDGGGGLPASLMLYGEYDTTISMFNYSFLDNKQALDSHINGEIKLPYPSGITLPFTSLELTGCGDVGGADVADVDRTLAYWQGQFLFANLEFKPTGGVSSCGTVEKTMWTTSSNQVPRVTAALLMETNFLGNGDIAENELIGEAKNTLDNFSYTLRRVFYTRWDGTTNPNGLTVLIGDIKLPFWGATPVKALVDAAGSSYIRQGRNFAENPPVDNDADQDGFPDGSGISSMSAYDAHVSYHPNVKGKFANIIAFDYPVVYNRLLEKFASPETKSTDLVVLNMESSVRSITRQQTEVLFGASYEGLPTLNLSQLAGDIASPAIEAFLEPLQDEFDNITSKLNGNLADELKNPISTHINGHVQTYLNGVKTAVETMPPGAALDAQLDTLRNDMMTQVKSGLQPFLRNATGPVQMRAKQALTSLDQLEDLLSSIDIEMIRDILVALIEFTGNDPSGVEAFLTEVQTAKTTVENIVKEQIRPPIEELNAQIESFNSFLLLDDVLAESSLYNSAIAGMDNAAKQYTNSVKANVDVVSNLSTTPFKNAMANAYLNSSQFTSLNAQVHTLFAPLKQQMQESTLSLLDVLNNTVNEYLDEIGAALNDQLAALNDVIGVKSAKMNGYAVFSAETLDRLHIGAEFAMSAPDDIEFSASLDMERIKSDGTGASCGVPDSGDTIKVTIMAGGIPLAMGIGDLEATIAVMVTLWDNAGDIQVRNFAGSIDTNGSLGFASVQLIDPGFGIGVGLDENYFYFVGKVKLDGVVAKGGIFLGRNCDGGTILAKIDPEVADVIQVTEIAGIFTSAEAAIPIIDYGCFLRAGATVGAGFWFFVNGPQYGAKLTGGLYGEAACIVSVRGRMTLIGAKDAVGYVLAGNAWVAGGIGFCEPEDWFSPSDVFDDDWCATCVAFVKLIYRPKDDWNADYDVECSL